MTRCVSWITEFVDFLDRPIKRKAKRLKLLRFEIWIWFRLQVKMRGGGWAPLNELISNTGPLFFTWRQNQNQISKRSNFSLCSYRTMEEVHKLNNPEYKPSSVSFSIYNASCFEFWRFQFRIMAVRQTDCLTTFLSLFSSHPEYYLRRWTSCGTDWPLLRPSRRHSRATGRAEESAQWPTYVRCLQKQVSTLSATLSYTTFNNGTCFNVDKRSARAGTPTPN